VIDGQSIKTAEADGPRGYDAGKKIIGRKRQAPRDPVHNDPVDLITSVGDQAFALVARAIPYT
jgi:hypothetical protein